MMRERRTLRRLLCAYVFNQDFPVKEVSCLLQERSIFSKCSSLGNVSLMQYSKSKKGLSLYAWNMALKCSMPVCVWKGNFNCVRTKLGNWVLEGGQSFSTEQWTAKEAETGLSSFNPAKYCKCQLLLGAASRNWAPGLFTNWNQNIPEYSSLLVISISSLNADTGIWY